MPQPTPADRALQALNDSIGGARTRRPEDATDPAIPVAATVVLLRDSSSGLEVLMIEWPDRGSFAGAWVFPGGKLEVDDVKVHKVPVQEDGVWTQVPRYTFEGMDIEVTN